MNGPSYPAMGEQLTTAITVAAITARKHDLLMLHAGAVADPVTGAVVAFIGRSGAGKTTAIIALARHFGYVTDETTAIQDDLVVVPYPKPLSVINPGPDHHKDQLSPDDLGLLDLPALPLKIVALLVLDRSDDHPADAPAVLEPVELADVVPELVAQISFLSARERPLQRLQDLVHACGGLQRVSYREASSLHVVVRALFDSPEVASRLATDTVIGAPRSEQATSAPIGSVADVPHYQCSPVNDAIGQDGRVIVLQGNRVQVLDGIAPALWSAAARPRSLDDLVAAVLAVHGAPVGGGATGLVRAAADELVEGGILTRH